MYRNTNDTDSDNVSRMNLSFLLTKRSLVVGNRHGCLSGRIMSMYDVQVSINQSPVVHRYGEGFCF
jgi:hypothetical protein